MSDLEAYFRILPEKARRHMHGSHDVQGWSPHYSLGSSLGVSNVDRYGHRVDRTGIGSTLVPSLFV
jgi:hypothetical protein